MQQTPRGLAETYEEVPTGAIYATQPQHPGHAVEQQAVALSLVDQLVDRLADRIAPVIADRMGSADNTEVEWFDSRRAAEHLGVHRDTLRKLAAERAIPSEQEGAVCKLYFRRADLDAWRRSGRRPGHLASVLLEAA